MLQLVLFYDAAKKAHSISKQSNTFRQEFNLQDQTNETSLLYTLQAKEIKRKAQRERRTQHMKETRENKPLHGRHPK